MDRAGRQGGVDAAGRDARAGDTIKDTGCDRDRALNGARFSFFWK